MNIKYFLLEKNEGKVLCTFFVLNFFTRFVFLQMANEVVEENKTTNFSM
jgi:hypothetical protein